MEYGTRLREIRKAKGFSMYKLHKESGLSQGHISDLEKCINQPTIETLQKLLTPMGVTLAEFFNEEGEAPERERRRQEAILAIKKKYGKNAILKGLNFEEGATQRQRNKQVGGHKA